MKKQNNPVGCQKYGLKSYNFLKLRHRIVLYEKQLYMAKNINNGRALKKRSKIKRFRSNCLISFDTSMRKTEFIHFFLLFCLVLSSMRCRKMMLWDSHCFSFRISTLLYTYNFYVKSLTLVSCTHTKKEKRSKRELNYYRQDIDFLCAVLLLIVWPTNKPSKRARDGPNTKIFLYVKKVSMAERRIITTKQQIKDKKALACRARNGDTINHWKNKIKVRKTNEIFDWSQNKFNKNL